jgi:hypothetical protein
MTPVTEADPPGSLYGKSNPRTANTIHLYDRHVVWFECSNKSNVRDCSHIRPDHHNMGNLRSWREFETEP